MVGGKFVAIVGSESDSHIAPDQLKANVTAAALTSWMRDILNLATDKGELYLAEVLNLFNCRAMSIEHAAKHARPRRGRTPHLVQFRAAPDAEPIFLHAG